VGFAVQVIRLNSSPMSVVKTGSVSPSALCLHCRWADIVSAAEYVRQDVRVRSNRDSRYQQMLSAFPPTAPASVKTLRAVRELLSILDRSGFEFSLSRFLADPLTRHPPKPVCLDFDVRLRQSVGMSDVSMSKARA